VSERRSILAKKGIVRAVLAFIAVFLLALAFALVFPQLPVAVLWWIPAIVAAFLAYRGRI
jgi:hypothetical protein